MDIANLTKVWRGEMDDPYAVTSVVGTIAITLRAMGKARSIQEAEVLAQGVWEARNRDFLTGQG